MTTLSKSSAGQAYHRSVLPKEVLQYLKIKPDGWYLDGTAGDGGHSLLIAQDGGRVWGNDADDEALERAQDRLQEFLKTNVPAMRPPYRKPDTDVRLFLTKGHFEDMDQIWQQLRLPLLSGILLDLGASTLQLTSNKRGFSFEGSANLDMRMDPSLGVTAADLLNALSEKELTKMFFEYGGESMGRKIAIAIVNARKTQPFLTTDQLAGLIEKLKPRIGKLHPATKVFQALRIAVNSELPALKTALPAALKILAPQGRLVIIAFHEGEDALVKHFLKKEEQINNLTVLTPKPIKPSAEEIKDNPRARSALLRAAVKN